MKYRTVIIIASLLIVAGCASRSLSIETTSEVPAPLVTQLPLQIGVYYDEQFRNYIYEENTEDRPNWSIKTGKSQVELFNKILPSLFSKVSNLNGIPDNQDNIDKLDIIIAPQVDEMQFALPSETKTDFFEVWIKYNIRLHSPDGELIAEWPITGYGKTTTELFKGRDKGLNTAFDSAFRDAGAKFVLGFERINEIKRLLNDSPLASGNTKTTPD